MSVLPHYRKALKLVYSCRESTRNSIQNYIPISCPNKCNAHIPRDDLTKHTDVSNETYFNVGCKAPIILKDKKMHNKTKVEEHLSLTAHKFNYIQQELTAMKQQLQENLATLDTTFQEAPTKLETKN